MTVKIEVYENEINPRNYLGTVEGDDFDHAAWVAQNEYPHLTVFEKHGDNKLLMVTPICDEDCQCDDCYVPRY